MNKTFFREKLILLFRRYGVFRVLALPFYPITLVLTNPVNMIRTLWASRVLLDGKWGRYSSFDSALSMVSLFYWGAALNLYTYGFRGKGRNLGLDGYPLSRWFQFTFLSLYAFWGAGAVSVMLSMLGWLGFHLLWVTQVETVWLLTVVAVTFVSTTYYAQIFGGQNYNAIGWMFFPIGIYGLMTNNYWVASLGWFLCSFGSFTAVFIAGMLVCAECLWQFNPSPFFSLIPVALKMLFHFIPMVEDGSIWKALLNVGKSIGLWKVNAKYVRRDKRSANMLRLIYQLVLYAQFAFLCLHFHVDIHILLSMIGIVILHGTVLHFGDIENVNIAVLSVGAASTIVSQQPLLLLSYWLLASPLPAFSNFSPPRRLETVPVLKPIDIQPLLDGMHEFLAPVPKGKRVFMAFENPEGRYDRLFDGQRWNIDLPHYVAQVREIQVFPYWWAVLETNYEGSPDFWGRRPDEVIENMKKWSCDFAIVYQGEEETVLADKWASVGLVPMTEFSWSKYCDMIGGTFPRPNWWLLTRKHSQSQRSDI